MLPRRLRWRVSLGESVDKVDLRIDPGQFILQNENDIRKVYTFQKKLGEGNSLIQLKVHLVLSTKEFIMFQRIPEL
jgi:hypothetical protein